MGNSSTIFGDNQQIDTSTSEFEIDKRYSKIDVPIPAKDGPLINIEMNIDAIVCDDLISMVSRNQITDIEFLMDYDEKHLKSCLKYLKIDVNCEDKEKMCFYVVRSIRRRIIKKEIKKEKQSTQNTISQKKTKLFYFLLCRENNVEQKLGKIN